MTEPAPIDLLIQRIGRLHRHQRAQRPSHLVEPRCLITQPKEDHETLSFGTSEYVYHPFLLLATWHAIAGKRSLLLPQESRHLIEFVYGQLWKEDASHQATLQAAYDEMHRKHEDAALEARRRRIPYPTSDDLFQRPADVFEEENPALHKDFQAMTRLIEASISLICLHEIDGICYLEPETNLPVDLNAKPNPAQLLRYVITLQHKEIVARILENAVFGLPNAWAAEPALRHHRVLYFRDGLCKVPHSSYVLRLSRVYGLEILKENK